MTRREARTRAKRLAAASLLACSLIAVLRFLRTDLPTGWLLAWTLPAALFGLVRHRSRRPWLRALAACLVQSVAFAMAVRWSSPPPPAMTIACTLLPPLAFTTVRRRDADAGLGLFLTFCLLIIGVILDEARPVSLAAYAVFACISLRSEASLSALDATSPPVSDLARVPGTATLLMTSLVLVVPSLFAALVIDRAIAWLPSPLHGEERSGSSPSSSSRAPRSRGLADSFDLDSGGVLSGLGGEQLVLVRTGDGSPMPSDLYLRSGFFATPRLDRWLIGRHAPVQVSGRRHHILRRPTPDVPERWLEIERYDGARNFVFVPPGATKLQEVPALRFDRQRMWLRQAPGAEQTDYAVAFQPPPVLTRGTRIDHSMDVELLSVPPDLRPRDRERFEQLLLSWDAQGSPSRIAGRIAAGLAARCRYARAEPRGPYRHSIDNFLFAPADRRGYCMHFATAAAIALRFRGVPCRIGVGLYGGSPYAREPGARIYGSQHAHAWVEIPIEGRGFLVFDPTPPVGRGRPVQRDGDERKAASEPPLAGTAAPFSLGRLADFLTEPWLLAIVLLLAIASIRWPSRRDERAKAIRPRETARIARRQLGRILRALAKAGHPRRRGQTLEQFGAMLAARGRFSPELASAFHAYQEVRFGGRPYDEPRDHLLRRGIEAARKLG